MLDSTRNKHLNDLLRQLYERVTQRELDHSHWLQVIGASVKERAIAKIRAIEAREIYLDIYRKIELIAPINKKNLENYTAMIHKTEENLAEIQQVLRYSELAKNLEYKSPLSEAIEGDFKLANQHGYRLPASVRSAFEILAKIGLLRKTIDIDSLLSIPSDVQLPRGNPLKGGMVKKLCSKGYTKDQANAIADKLISSGATSVLAAENYTSVVSAVLAEAPQLTPEQKIALAQVNKDRNEKSNADLLAMLGADDGEPQIDLTTDENDIDTSFDSNFSKEKEAS